jgi:hypothetical protein
LPEEVAFAEKP